MHLRLPPILCLVASAGIIHGCDGRKVGAFKLSQFPNFSPPADETVSQARASNNRNSIEISGSNRIPSDSNIGGEGKDDRLIGVKTHQPSYKSNAVGDPDGDGSDSDDESDSDYDGMDWDSVQHDLREENLLDIEASEVEVQVEVMDGGGASSDDEESERGGGVELLYEEKVHSKNRKDRVTRTKLANEKGREEVIADAWSHFVFPPPTSWVMLKDKARALDAQSKMRLDRRTLYACLVLEWLSLSVNDRRFLPSRQSQELQAALSLAIQPKWRSAVSRKSALRLYDRSNPNKGCTLAMQESIAMALAHSLGAAFVRVDDDTISSIERSVSKQIPDQELKPTLVLQSLLHAAKHGMLLEQSSATISTCMKQDIEQGLDDPFDERAITSCTDMEDVETALEYSGPGRDLPLVIFLRGDASKKLLSSKSAVDVLLKEADSVDSSNLIVLGRGVDATTRSVPESDIQDVAEPVPQENSQMASANGGAPWFGFSPNNQNASGQNDPEGSRRFNIFLARTMNADGDMSILGAVAPPQAGNLFPHMMAMQARERLENQDDDSPMRAELERWAQLLQQQMQSSGGSALPPPQFFNASLTHNSNDESNVAPPPPHIIQETLQAAMSELLDRLSEMKNDGISGDDSGWSSETHMAFAQVLRNENLRRGIAENLARAAPALSDPKCQGVMLSVYIPPPPNQQNRGKVPDRGISAPMSGWFQKILNHQEDSSGEDEKSSRQRRTRTMAAAAAVMAAREGQDKSKPVVNESGNVDSNRAERSKPVVNESGNVDSNRAERNLARLESVCREFVVSTPFDPVRAKSWNAWIQRERGSVTFRRNREALREVLDQYSLRLKEQTGTRGAGSSLRQMLSVRDLKKDMTKVIEFAISLEASRGRRLEMVESEDQDETAGLEADITLSQLMLTNQGLVEDDPESLHDEWRELHPSSLETAFSTICKISASPAGGLSLSSSTGTVPHRSREEINALAQDKHERALVSQVASPQDIGVTYDMIGGLSNVKELLRQSITYPLKYPHLYSEGIAREAVKGVLLFGPPGTGKTMLAKAVATEGGASFLSVDASSVENKWLGESEKNAKAVFTLARRLAPCVIFIDEVDSLLSSREGSSDDSAHGTLTSVKTTMMSEWDGLNSGTNGSGDRVVVIGSTNRPFDLDEAVLRRFPRRLLVDLPDLETRSEILEVTLAENRLDPSVNLTAIAEKLEGYTGSDIKEVCREAVVQISHDLARHLDQGTLATSEDYSAGSPQRLRPVTVKDFEKAMEKLKRSVSEKGRELARIWEWNDEYGEVKKVKKNDRLSSMANMYL